VTLTVTLLGTGSPIPSADRAGPATLISAGSGGNAEHYLVDAGRGVLMRLAALGLGAPNLAAVLITHLHSDHITDLNDVITTRWVMTLQPTPLTIVGPVGTHAVVDHIMASLAPDIAYRLAHHEDLTEPPRVTVVEVDSGPVEMPGRVAIRCAPTDHRPVEPSVGFRFDFDGVGVVTAGDTVPCAGLDSLCTGADALVHTVIRKDVIANIPLQRIKDTLPHSLILMLYVQILVLLIAVPLGIYTAYRAGHVADHASNIISFFLLSVPVYIAASIMILVFSVHSYGIHLPSEGWIALSTNPAQHFSHLVMPVVAIALGQIAVYARLLRSDMVATLQEDYILMAKSKGMTNGRILWRHALRPSSLTLITVAGLNVGALVSGALIVEVIFRLNGIGLAIYDAINRRQYIALQDYVAVVAIVYVLVNFGVDALYRVLDPRIRNA
jgi:ribonuclease Z